MPRKLRYQKLKAKALANPTFAAEWKASRRKERKAPWYADMPADKKKAYIRRGQLKKSGWNAQTFAAAKESQGGRCAICGEVPKTLQGCAEGLVGDHKHVKPPQPRGLLCNSCNSVLGFAKDSPVICEAAANYLRKYS